MVKKAVVFTKDKALKKELAELLPRGLTLSSDEKGVVQGQIIFFDMDTLRPGLIREYSESNFVIGLTKQKKTDPVIEATTFGTYEVLLRPLKRESLLNLLQELQLLSTELEAAIPVNPPPPAPTCAIIGSSPSIMNVCKQIARLAQVEVPVLITGETGTGKELIAESIAQLSSRFGKPFVVINCAAVPESLLESELFGFEKGAFSGAFAPKEGMLKVADSGTVFFDEIGELPLALQGKLLRFIQTQTFYPLGSTREVQVNVRVISATNQDLARMVREGKFRGDLYHRLRVATIHNPSLRERKSDIPGLINFFIYRYKDTVQKQIKGITKAFLQRMTSYEWPGNIRELENTVRSAMAYSKAQHLTTFEIKDLGSHAIATGDSETADELGSVLIPFVKKAISQRTKHLYDEVHREVDKHLIEYVLSTTKENQSEAARLLGISRLTLRKKIHR